MFKYFSNFCIYINNFKKINYVPPHKYLMQSASTSEYVTLPSLFPSNTPKYPLIS